MANTARPKANWVKISPMWLSRQEQKDSNGNTVGVNVWMSRKLGEEGFRVQVRGNTFKVGGDDPKVPDGHMIVDSSNLQGLIDHLIELRDKQSGTDIIGETVVKKETTRKTGNGRRKKTETETG